MQYFWEAGLTRPTHRVHMPSKRSAIPLLAALCLLFLAPAFLAQAREFGYEALEEPSLEEFSGPKTRYFASADFFLPGSAANGLEADAAKAAPYSRVETGPGVGLRAGALYRLTQSLGFGASLGHLRGPDSQVLLEAPGGLAAGERTSAFTRALLETRYEFPLGERWSARLGAGFGYAWASTQESCSGTLAASCTAARSASWGGLSWEAGPALVLRLGRAELTLGARYASFPRFKGSPTMSEFKWNAPGLLLGIEF